MIKVSDQKIYAVRRCWSVRSEALAVFIAIAQCRSLAGAARVCHLSQPAVSSILAALEEETGCRLVERKSRQRTPLELTRSGEIFLAYAQSAQTLEQQMREELSALHEQQTTLILGSGPTSSALLLPRLTQLFRRRFPHIPLVGKACPSSADVYDLLTQGGCCFGLTSYLPQEDRFGLHPLLRDPFVLVVPRSISLPRTISCRELLSLPLILREEGCYSLQLLREKLEDLGHSTGELNVVLQVFGNSAVKQAAAMGMGCGFVAASSILPEDRNFRQVAVSDLTLERWIYLTWYRQRERTAQEETFFRFASSPTTAKALSTASLK